MDGAHYLMFRTCDLRVHHAPASGTALKILQSQCRAAHCSFSGPEAGKRKRVRRKADGKLTLLVNTVGSWHEKLTLLVTHFSLPILAYPFQGH